ncbi:MAG: IS1 family transposase, partial [Flammeovirgaceae bacterium]
KKYQRAIYKNHACHIGTDKNIVRLLVEGMGIRGISRVTNISPTTVISRIKRIAKALNKTYHYVKGKTYEVDELWTYIGSKQNDAWVMYAIERESREVVDFRVGARTKINLEGIARSTLATTPKKVCTEGLNIYKTLVPGILHKVGLPNTRHIERFNLNLRTHLKRLSRKTICFSKSKEMLEGCLKIYFWGRTESLNLLNG